MVGGGREALTEVQEWSEGPPGGQEVDVRPSRIYRSGREAFPEVREANPEVREWSGVPPGVPVVVGSGREALTEVQVWSEGTPGGPGVVVRPSRIFQEWARGLPGGPGVVWRLFRISGSGRESLLVFR